ncbi:MAG TPA: glycine/sarcosine/betaine reductase complex component C subunit beta [bacterium]|nr:glycine/sarcosine/betaine reductase complex component C subunit beta [bacterium]
MTTEGAGPVLGLRPVVRAARFAIAHTPGLIAAGSKPRRELASRGAAEREALVRHLRSFEDAVRYPPHQVMLGALPPEALRGIPRPWHDRPVDGARAEGPAGRMLDETEFYAWLARADTASLLYVTPEFAKTLRSFGAPDQIQTMAAADLARAAARGAEPLRRAPDETVGVLVPGHEQDESLAAAVLLENLAAKVTGALALRALLDAVPADGTVDYLLGCGEEAVGDRYQRGGGNLAKTIGELAGVRTAGASDVKSFCASPLHALLVAGALVAAGVHRRVVVVAGGSLAKLGMKYRGHVAAGYPVLEDVIVGAAVDVVPDDGRSPVLRLDAAAVHRVGDGAAPHQMAQVLSAAPLRAAGLRLSDVDRYAVELHNPDITEPAGSGDVPYRNYQMIAALAAQGGEIDRAGMDAFIAAHGMPGFSPTQGHIASAVAYLPHAIAGLSDGRLRRVQLVAKGSLFLGRMTNMADGVSLLLERNETPPAGGGVA